MRSTQSKKKCKSEVFNIHADGRMWKYILKAIRETTARGPETELWDEDKPALVCSYNFSFLFTWSILFTLVYTCCLSFFCILLVRFFNFFPCLVFFLTISLILRNAFLLVLWWAALWVCEALDGCSWIQSGHVMAWCHGNRGPGLLSSHICFI